MSNTRSALATFQRLLIESKQEPADLWQLNFPSGN